MRRALLTFLTLSLTTAVLATDAPCPLGVGVQVDSAVNAEVKGLYEQGANSSYDQLDGVHRVSWHNSNCGWVVERDNATRVPDTPIPPTCVDDVAAANFAFSQSGLEYQADICTIAAAWGTGDYCQNKVFAGLCAATCSVPVPVCTANNEEAAKEHLMRSGVADPPTPYCAHAQAECSNAVFASLCKLKCDPERRLEAAVDSSERRLGWSGDSRYEEIFTTFDPNSCVAQSQDTGLLTMDALYDLRAYHSEVEAANENRLRLGFFCPAYVAYIEHGEYYCQHRNLLAPFNTNKDIVNNQCRYKCKDDVVDAAKSCTGNSARFGNNSNALCLPRAECEDLCTKTAECHSIDMHKTLPRCYLNTFDCVGNPKTPGYPGIVNASWSLVIKTPRADKNCEVTVENDPSSVFDGMYAGSVVANASYYVRADNRTRLAWTTATSDQCQGWSLQKNMYGSEDSVTIGNCSDSALAANLYLFGENTTFHKRFVCEWGREVGQCVDKAFRGLCAFSCSPVINATIGGELWFFQNETLKIEPLWSSTCWGDNHEGITVARANGNVSHGIVLPYTSSVLSPCGDMWNVTGFYNSTHSPCHYGIYAPVVQALCKATCQNLAPPPPAPTPVPTDEGNYALGQNAPWRRLTSGTQLDAYHIVVRHLPANHTMWANVYRTWRNGSVAASTCPVVLPHAEPDTTLLATDEIYRWDVPQETTSKIEYICRNVSICPELTTCVLHPTRFAAEMGLWRTSGVPWSQWLSSVSSTTRESLLDPARLVPKTIVSTERTEAVLIYAKWEFNKDLFRNVQGSSRFTVRNVGLVDATLVLSMAGGDSSTSMTQFGREYPVPYGFHPWRTDVLRVERFSMTGGAVWNMGRFEVDIYAPAVATPRVFAFKPSVAAGVQLDSSAVTSLGGGWFRLVLHEVGVDVVATEDLLECATPLDHCHEKATCIERVGALPECVCAVPYVGDGQTCLLKSYTFGSSPVPLNYFRLYHSSPLDYGWRLSDIRLYKDEACTQQFTRTAYGGRGSGTQVWSSATYPNYAGVSYAKENLFDDSAATEWWSECLNCNPEEIEEAHGSAAQVTFTFQETHAGESVRCVKITQAENHMATGLVLERGPASGFNCGFGEGQKRCPTTQTWNMEEAGVEVIFKASCGLADTQIFGEMLVNRVDGAETGNYHDVPSACQCQQLCIEHIEEGCRSYKYYTEFRHCILQTNVFKQGEGYWGAPSRAGFVGWTSGDFQMEGALRLTGFTTVPEKVVPGELFSLTLNGVGLPNHADPSLDASPRQRVKIIAADATCKDEIPITVAGIGCSRTDTEVRTSSGMRDETWYTICSPRPGDASTEHATWKNLKVSSAKQDREYKICYCIGTSGCYEPSDYIVVPGPSMKVKGSTFEWLSEPKELLRKMDPNNTFTLTIKRPAFGTYTTPSAWRVKIVRSYFGCSVKGDPALFELPTSGGALTVDSASWNVTINSNNFTSQDTGTYLVCFSEGGSSAYDALPSADSRYLTINGIPEDTLVPRGVYGGQRFSAMAGKAGAPVTTRIVVKGSRLVLPTENVLALSNHAGGECGNSATMSFAGDSITAWQFDDAKRALFYPTNMQSTADEIAYDLPLYNVPSGQYQVCMCDASADVDRAGLVNKDSLPVFNKPTGSLSQNTTYRVHDDVKCLDTNYLATSSLDTVWKDHQCKSKCAKGCIGGDCFCEHYTPGVTPDTALCLSPQMCRQACDETSGCKGVDTQEGNYQCYLTSAPFTSSACPANESFVHVEKHDGVSCTNATDFTNYVGTLYVTDRAFLGNDYVFHPGKPASVEIVAPEGSSLTYNDYGTSKDRIMVVDCKGVCGVSSPTTYVVLPEKATTTVTWNLFWPMGQFIDAPHNDTQNPVQIPPQADAPTEYQYGEKVGFYCPGHNFDMSQPQFSHGKKHQCYSKCSLNAPCVGDDCFCTGHYSGYDGPTSNALCLNETGCQQLCNLYGDCSGYDMHRTLPRCFLNTFGCDNNMHEDLLGRDENYKLVQKLRDPTDTGSTPGANGPATTGRRMATMMGRQLLAPVDRGHSWDRMLRFAPVEITTGGTFKVCFCDSALLPENATCSSTRDYTIEVGKIHSSGVSCLLADDAQRFTKGKCVKQFYGGMRCYREGEVVPSVPVPTQPSYVQGTLTFSSPAQLNTWCVFGPEEDTQQDARCQAVTGGQSTV